MCLQHGDQIIKAEYESPGQVFPWSFTCRRIRCTPNVGSDRFHRDEALTECVRWSSQKLTEPNTPGGVMHAARTRLGVRPLIGYPYLTHLNLVYGLCGAGVAQRSNIIGLMAFLSDCRTRWIPLLIVSKPTPERLRVPRIVHRSEPAKQPQRSLRDVRPNSFLE